MVPPTGFEPVTSSLPMMRSTAGAMRAIKLDRPLGIEPRLSRIKIWRVANYTMAEQSFTNSALLLFFGFKNMSDFLLEVFYFIFLFSSS